MPTPVIRSLRVRLSILVIAVLTVILAVFGTYGQQQLAQELNENFAVARTATANRVAASVATPLWEVNDEALASILRAELASPDVVLMQV